MEDFFKNLKERFSIDNVVTFMKEAKLVDEDKIEEVSEPLVENAVAENVTIVEEAQKNINDEPNLKTVIDGDMPIILNEVLSKSKHNISDIPDQSMVNILQKPSSSEEKPVPELETPNTNNQQGRMTKTTEISLFF
ncbi:uncharacterized protein LOC133319999 [Danaus plexippus]|uniref:uncharacterized protein LOC133319999 n=1 Tax=Danaus plexippus TaxID=13037 RepID=UPI002AB1375D|nr:uncharacterized protein LOC133319999 [Danaus plexippus]